jgi:hypothetical protein
MSPLLQPHVAGDGRARRSSLEAHRRHHSRRHPISLP